MANIFLTLDTSFSMSKTWIVSLFRGLFAFFDSLIYTLISWLFRAVFNLANFELYGVYEDMMDRVYVILGIFMLFKITVSLITYLADPDKINDKEQGISKLITRIITVMVMLIGLPTFFSLMTEAQNKILPVIPRIIINSPTTLSSDDVTGISEKLATTMLNGFAHVKTGCSNAAISKPFDFLKVVNDSCESADDSNSDAYAYDYLPIVSTITGVIMIYVIFSFCISVAIRAFKLIILRSISPIPVLSYIDPKAEKDGGAFSTWKKTFFSTWLELFINLGLIYFIIYIIDMLLSGDMYKGFFDGVNFLDGVFLLAFLLIGLLMFARQAPQFIFDALGIKNKGNFTRMLGLGATAVGGIGAIGSAYRSRNEYDQANGNGSHKLRNFGASLFTGAAAVNSGGNEILTADKPNLLTGIDAQAKNTATALRRINAGSTLGGRLLSRASGIILGQTPADKFRKRKEDLDNVEKQIKDFKSTIESRFDGNEDFMINYNGHSFNWLNFDKTITAANNGDSDAISTLSSWGLTTQQAREQYEKIHKEGYKQFTSAVVNKTGVNGSKDSVVLGKLAEVKDSIKGISVYDYDEFGELVKDASGNPVSISLDTLDFSNYSNVVKPTIGDISGTKRDLEASHDYKAAMADDKETKK